MILQRQLPAGWFASDELELNSRMEEYRRELPARHRLADVPVSIVAYRKGTDDILLRHLDGSASDGS